MLDAQAPAPSSTGIEPILSLRLRAESWDWFDAGTEGRYGLGHAFARFGATQRSAAWQWRLEGAAVALIGLPTDAALASPQGALGLGAVYYAANAQETSPSSIFLRQAWLRWTRDGHAIRGGRFEFGDGLERTPRDPSLAALKAQRIGQRLVGSFAFSPVQRAFDGAQYSYDRGATNLTAVAMRPTAGAFSVDAQEGLNVNLAYASASHGRVGDTGEIDARLFGLWYSDRRGTVPVDNRALAARQADRGDINVVTIGGHLIGNRRVGDATIDGLVWGAVQVGEWGTLDHGATAIAVEGGVQHASFPWSLWLRGGWLHTSGDGDAADARHGSFFQVLPTPRLYARFPFYNLMNSSELFVTASAKPARSVGMRAGVHAVSVAETADLWYLGGGAFDQTTFGFVGRPSSGASSLAAVIDLSVSWQVRPKIALELYGAAARGGDVVSRIYDGNRNGGFLYVETTFTR